MRVLLLDNYDSFVYNLAQYVGQTADQVIVKRNDELTVQDAERIKPDHIIISPGPGNPTDARSFGCCADVIRSLGTTVPVLGVCLGHQGIASSFGGRIVRTPNLRHGKTSVIRHDGRGVFRGVAKTFAATRYHSLVVDRKSLPATLEVSAESTDDHEIMGLRHRTLPIEGVQFHPESILTVPGRRIIENFLTM